MVTLSGKNGLLALLEFARRQHSELEAEIGVATAEKKLVIEYSIPAMLIIIICRSILDHVASQVFLCISEVPIKRSPSFPISQNEDDFLKQIRDFPDLRIKLPYVYTVFEQAQPWPQNHPWLIDLNRNANILKHNNLGPIIPFEEIIGFSNREAALKAKNNNIDKYLKGIYVRDYAFKITNTNIITATFDYIDYVYGIILALDYHDWVTGDLVE